MHETAPSALQEQPSVAAAMIDKGLMSQSLCCLHKLVYHIVVDSLFWSKQGVMVFVSSNSSRGLGFAADLPGAEVFSFL